MSRSYAFPGLCRDPAPGVCYAIYPSPSMDRNTQLYAVLFVFFQDPVAMGGFQPQVRGSTRESEHTIIRLMSCPVVCFPEPGPDPVSGLLFVSTQSINRHEHSMCHVCVPPRALSWSA